MTSSSTVTFARDGHIAVITLNRPEQRNAINAEMGAALSDAISELEDTQDLHVGILRGAGPAFCAGMDLGAFLSGEAERILFGPGRLGGLVSRTRRTPLIASVHGPAIAGGFELVLACDLAVASRDAVFGLPEAKIGLIAGAGGAIRLAQCLPRVVANELLLTGRTITAERAAALGLINQVVAQEDLEATVRALAADVADAVPASVAASLEIAQKARSESDEGLWHENDRHLRARLASDEAKHAAQAFQKSGKS
ncbi:MAG: enoyl-CoA hydratase-related protein [Pseudomonadota bacterium]